MSSSSLTENTRVVPQVVNLQCPSLRSPSEPCRPGGHCSKKIYFRFVLIYCLAAPKVCRRLF